MATPFRPAVQLLQQYARYHRDRRNIATHLVGVPMIVFGIGVLLSRPELPLGGWALTPAWAVYALAALWYVTRGRLGIGLATAAGVGLLIALAHAAVADAGVARWLTWGVGFFVVGWIVQFVGHHWEGRKPAFADDIVGLLVGPMFVVLELLALAGMCKALMAEVEGDAGPTLVRGPARPAAR